MDCSVENCTKPQRAKTLCASHYQKKLRHGTPTPDPALMKRPGRKPDPSKYRSRYNPNNPSRSRPKKEKVERTHCKQGHELSEDNRYWHSTSKSWTCRTCAKNATRKYRATRDSRDLTKCRRGHDITPENTVTFPSGKTRCLPCLRINAQSQRLKKYGISQSDYEALLNHQGGVCAICNRTMQGSRDEVVDHDHKTGQVRGIIHGNCNIALGMLNDDPELLINAAKYLMDSWRLSS